MRPRKRRTVGRLLLRLGQRVDRGPRFVPRLAAHEIDDRFLCVACVRLVFRREARARRILATSADAAAGDALVLADSVARWAGGASTARHRENGETKTSASERAAPRARSLAASNRHRLPPFAHPRFGQRAKVRLRAEAAHDRREAPLKRFTKVESGGGRIGLGILGSELPSLKMIFLWPRTRNAMASRATSGDH